MERVTSFVRPAYPPQSLAAQSMGVAVAEVTLEGNGRVRKVKMLEAPDELIGAACKEALSRWIFQPLVFEVGAPPEPSQGRITFYFTIDAGRGVVQTGVERVRDRASSRSGS